MPGGKPARASSMRQRPHLRRQDAIVPPSPQGTRRSPPDSASASPAVLPAIRPNRSGKAGEAAPPAIRFQYGRSCARVAAEAASSLWPAVQEGNERVAWGSERDSPTPAGGLRDKTQFRQKYSPGHSVYDEMMRHQQAGGRVRRAPPGKTERPSQPDPGSSPGLSAPQRPPTSSARFS